VQHEGTPVTRESILEDVWGLRDTDTGRSNFIVRLRRHIEDDTAKPVTCRRSAASATASSPILLTIQTTR
jgi:DNA-binding response OmpR family regulator